MKTVEWTGPERTVGVYGYVKVGVVKELPDVLADQFQKMGWCVIKGSEVKPKVKKEVNR